MEYKVIIQTQAEDDIGEAFEYIYKQGPEEAIRWYERLKNDIAGLSEMPHRYEVTPESAKLGTELRQLIFGKRSGRYRIVFRIVDARSEVHILTVRHGARKPLQRGDIDI